MKSPLHHLKHPEKLFEHFDKKIHHAFAIFALAIVGMLWGASHILTPTSASWQWGGFLNNDFWTQTPTTANIMYTLFGDGTPGSTAYTKIRDTSCIPTNITTISGGSIPTNMSANTIYVINSGTYNLSTSITMLGDCSAIVGNGKVTINGNGNSIFAEERNHIIIDNINFKGNPIQIGLTLNNSTNVTLNNLDIMNTDKAISSLSGTFLVSNSRLFNNNFGIYGRDGNTNGSVDTINNSLVYNNTTGVYAIISTINNSQVFNNTCGTHTRIASINNSSYYNNILGIQASSVGLNNTTLFNNTIAIKASYETKYFGTLKLFGNTTNVVGSTPFSGATTSFIPSWTAGVLDTGAVDLSYDFVTNPQNGSGKWLLSGDNRNVLRGPQGFDIIRQPIRYIFGGSVAKQTTPITTSTPIRSGGFEYGSDGFEYITTRYIAEPDSILPVSQQTLVDQYFGPHSTLNENWETNGCSLSAFQTKTLNPGNFSSSYMFEDHTIYILTGGTYNYTANSSNAFVFNGNCIAVLGTDITNFQKNTSTQPNAIFYANNKRNIIVDNIKINGAQLYGNPAQTIVKFDGATNNSTINNVQAYNAQYGIYLGQGSHHNTIINTQAFNNATAGIHLYYSSNYNVINNTQTYNNAGDGIRFANGSKRNTLNNFQSYNNNVGVFGDLTTQENVLNRAAIYNNSAVGIYFKNTSANILNDVQLYNNSIGIKTLYGSLGNMYYGEFTLFDNGLNFDGSNGNDTYLAAGTAGTFPYGGVLSTGAHIVGCLYVTNPTLSGTTTTLLNGNCTFTGSISSFQSTLGNSLINYAFGLNMYKQIVPVRYNQDNSLVQIPSQYNSGKYIAEIFAIRDTIPEGVNFIGSGAAQLATWYTSNVYTAAVINMPVPIRLTFDSLDTTGYIIVSGQNIGLTGIINNGDTIQISILTKTGYNQTTTGTINIGGATSYFVVTTRGMNQTPTTGSFAFTNFTSIAVNTFVSSITTVTGIETGVVASVNFDPSTTSGWLEIYSGSILMSQGTGGLLVNNLNQVKVVAQSRSGHSQVVTGYVQIGLGSGVFTIMTKGFDSVAPTTPTVTYPLSGERLFFVHFAWNPSVDTGSGIEGYVYQIAQDARFRENMQTGFIATSTGTTGSPSTRFDPNTGKYYWRIQARDNDGNLSARSNTGYFTYIGFDDRKFTHKEKASLRTEYKSNEITITTLGDYTALWASLDGDAVVYKNGNEVGTGTFVEDGDDIAISMRSSNQYDRTVSSKLTIANHVLEYRITTKDENDTSCNLDSEEQKSIQIIFDSLVESYSGDKNKFNDFLSTLQSMVSDEIDFSNDCNLKYFNGLINKAKGISDGAINTGLHIAPNCKEYPVSYDTVKAGYTSPVLKVAIYFANRDSFMRYIDTKNPGNCHINTYGASSWSFTNSDMNKHIAPNGKIYFIQNNGNNYSSDGFVVSKSFTTLAALRSFIDSKNPPLAVRSHEVDTSFTPQVYFAPNGKEYTIYKTNRGYMSYKLITVRYFGSLAEIQSFISKNNKK